MVLNNNFYNALYYLKGKYELDEMFMIGFWINSGATGTKHQDFTNLDIHLVLIFSLLKKIL